MSVRDRFGVALSAAIVVMFAYAGVASAASNSGGGGNTAGIILVLIYVAIIVGVIVFFVRNRQSFQVGTATTVSSTDVIQRAMQTYTMAGWQVLSHTADNASFVKHRKAGCFIAGLLFLCGIIPGIIYLILGGRSLTANVRARTTTGADTLVEIAGNAQGFGGKRTAQQVIDALPHVASI